MLCPGECSDVICSFRSAEKAKPKELELQANKKDSVKGEKD